MFTAALFTIVKTKKQLKCHNRRMDKEDVVHIYTHTHTHTHTAWILPNFPYLHSRSAPETILGEVQTPGAVAAPAVTPHPYSCHFTGPAGGTSHRKPDSGPNSHPCQGPPRAADLGAEHLRGSSLAETQVAPSPPRPAEQVLGSREKATDFDSDT